jgi:hypothetical protein
MIKSTVAAFSVLSTMCLSLLSGAHAEQWKPVGQMDWLGAGKLYPIEKGHFYWVGEFNGTFVSDKGAGSLFDQAVVKCPGFHDIDDVNMKGVLAGYCIVSDHDGDQAYIKWQAQGDGLAGKGTFDFIGGTGKYQGINGTNYFTAVIRLDPKDGTLSGTTIWNRGQAASSAGAGNGPP